ncbi:hypothetical protein [Brachybacterium sp. FME24]|nr:hypothetical protein [Brachybacterium sp. FME24]
MPRPTCGSPGSGAPVRLIGHQSDAGEEHAPILVGDVADALAP